MFDYGDNKFRAINVSSPLSIQTTNNAYLTINADCYTKSEVNSNLALKADKATTSTKTEIDTSLDTKHTKFIFGEIPPTNTSRLFGHGDNKEL